jgi:hypothetical protein
MCKCVEHLQPSTLTQVSPQARARVVRMRRWRDVSGCGCPLWDAGPWRHVRGHLPVLALGYFLT